MFDGETFLWTAFIYFTVQLLGGVIIGWRWRRPNGRTRFTTAWVLLYYVGLTATCSGVAYLCGARDVCYGVLLATGFTATMACIAHMPGDSG